MCSYIVFILLLTPVPVVLPTSTITLMEEGAKITTTLLENIYNRTNHEHKMFFSNLDTINVKVDEISIKAEASYKNQSLVSRLLRLPNVHKLESILNNVRMMQVYLNIYYRYMTKYVRDYHEYSNSTLLDFAAKISSNLPSSASSMINQMYENTLDKEFSDNLVRLFHPSETYTCREKQSLAQVLQDVMNLLLITNIKCYTTIYAAYSIKEFYSTGSYTKQIQDATKDFSARNDQMMLALRPYLKTRSALEIRSCDPIHHRSGETYLEIRNFIHLIILNKKNLNKNNKCHNDCRDYSIIEKYDCGDNEWCKKQLTCPKIFNCRDIESSLKVCPSNKMQETNRRYEYIELENGSTLGESKACYLNQLDSVPHWYFWKCPYCSCLCYEGPKYFSNLFINMQRVISNIDENKVVTGVRFVERNKIIHLQIQEGKLLPNGEIDLNTVQWVQSKNYTTADRNYIGGRDYHILTWEEREFQLVDIMAPEGSVVVGFRFILIKTCLHLEVLSSAFNFTSGHLTSSIPFESSGDKSINTELKLQDADIPTHSKLPSNKFTTNSFVKFTNSDLGKDAGQTTVPFFDAQPVESKLPVPLSGIGIFHKRRSGYGGFIAPRIFTYNFTKHLG